MKKRDTEERKVADGKGSVLQSFESRSRAGIETYRYLTPCLGLNFVINP
jgi:hypothetical protein